MPPLSERSRSLLLSLLAAVGAASGVSSVAVVPVGGQEPTDSPPMTYAEWQRSLPLEWAEAVALAEQVRSAGTPLPDHVVRVLAQLSAGLTYDPPGLRYAWGEDRRPNPPCEPAACAVLIEEMEGGDPPLDAFAFAVRWAMDPVRWSDSLLVRTDTASPMLEHAVSIVRAVLPDSRSPHALPGADASWREWRDWPRSFSSDRTARYLAQLAHLLHGRDVPAEIGRRYRSAVEDSARLAFGIRALELGVADVSLEQTLLDLESSSPAVRQLGLRQVQMLRAFAAPADKERTSHLQHRFLAILLDSAAPWPPHALNEGKHPLLASGVSSSESHPIMVVTDHLEAAMAEVWGTDPRLKLLPGAALDSISSIRSTSFIRIDPVVGIGPLVWVEASVGASGPRPPERGVFMGYPRTVYRLTLIRNDDGWRVLAETAIEVN